MDKLPVDLVEEALLANLNSSEKFLTDYGKLKRWLRDTTAIKALRETSDYATRFLFIHQGCTEPECGDIGNVVHLSKMKCNEVGRLT